MPIIVWEGAPVIRCCLHVAADSETAVAKAMTSVVLPCNRDATTPEEVYNLEDGERMWGTAS